MDKTYASAGEAISGLADGQTLLVGGFGLSGNPENLITAVHESGVTNMTLVSNNAGTDQCGLNALVTTHHAACMHHICITKLRLAVDNHVSTTTFCRGERPTRPTVEIRTHRSRTWRLSTDATAQKSSVGSRHYPYRSTHLETHRSGDLIRHTRINTDGPDR